MEFKLKSGRVVKMKKDISLDDRDSLMDNVQFELNEDGSMKSISMMNSTITKWLRTCIDGDTSDTELIKWSLEDRTDAFVNFQKELMKGEETASK
jgi:hypothetical protein